MRAFIAGGGRTGELVASRLLKEGIELVIIEKDSDRCSQLSAHLDAQVLHGDAGSFATWRKAGISADDMLIAVTSSDATNLLACLIVNDVSPGCIKAIELNNLEYADWERVLNHKQVRIDLVINPEATLAAKILPSLMYPGTTGIQDFASGRVRGFGIHVEEDSWLVDQSMLQLQDHNPPRNAMVTMISRADKIFTPSRDDKIMAGDLLYLLSSSDQMEDTLRFMGVGQRKKMHQVFIVGGGKLTESLAIMLEREHISAKIFERDKLRCDELASVLSRSIIINEDGTDQHVLEQENIDGVYAFLALTRGDNVNLITSLLAQGLGAKKVVALVDKVQNLSLANRVGVDTTVSIKMEVVDCVLRFIRGPGVQLVRTFGADLAEAIELIAPPHSRYINKPIKDMQLPRGTVVGAIIRTDDTVVIPRGNDIIEAGDHVVFATTQGSVQELEEEFLRDEQS